MTKDYGSRILRQSLLLGFLAIFFFQSLSAEKLILRSSPSGLSVVFSEPQIIGMSSACTQEVCCPLAMVLPLEDCHAAETLKSDGPMLCCSDLPVGGGLPFAGKLVQASQVPVNNSLYSDRVLHSSEPAEISAGYLLSLPHGPPGYVKTTVLRL